ncbi:TPA: type IV pili twitching motility protein PilT [bacterium]|nr:type IV pili twitching motility protein PilT [bacterium]
MEIGELLDLMVEKEASDLHIKPQRPPLYRIYGKIMPLDEIPPFTNEKTEGFAFSLMNQAQLDKFNTRHWTDLSYSHKKNRFRVNIYTEKGNVSLCIRKIQQETPTVDQLGLPSILKDIVSYSTGLILVTGPTGSGKSTTLAALIEEINQNVPCHIATIEDPIEYVFYDKKATISQREIGSDVVSYEDSLPPLLRQDPDVILIGEMRDRETIEIALKAAEAGHLLLSTLHTNSAASTMDRILSYFPSDMYSQIRIELAMTLRAVVSQRLIRRMDGSGRVAALEVMINSPTIKDLIEKGRFSEIYKVIEGSVYHYKMQTLEQALVALLINGVITQEDAYSSANNPNALRSIIHEFGMKKEEKKEEIVIEGG